MFVPGKLYLVTDGGMTGGRDLVQIVEQAVRGGVSLVQLREKELPTRQFVERARELVRLLRPLGVPLLVNDRVDVALAADADGVHIGQSDMTVADVRRLLPAGKVVGLSVENREQVLAAEALDVDYIGVSPVFATSTKTDTVIQWGLEGVAWIRANSRHPIVAIGGIHHANCAEVLAAGADSIAVVSAICAAEDPRAAAQKFLEII